MNVLLCHNYYKSPGGEDQVFHDEGWLLERHGHNVTRFEKHNADIGKLGKIGIARSTIWNASAKIGLDQAIQATRPDIVHFHNTFPLISPAAYSAARKHRVPVVQSLHNFRMICPGSTLVRNGKVCEKCVAKTFAWPSVVHGCYRGSRISTGVVAARNALHHQRGTWRNDVDVFIALTNHSKAVFVRSGFPEDKLVVKPNFVRPDPGPRVQEGQYAIFVGRLSPEKGIDVLLRAWLHQACEVPLVIVGDGPLRDDVAAAAARHPGITWMGQLPFEETLEKIRGSKVLIMPSIWYETFGRTMIEAFAAGVPVIASDIGAMQEIVSHGENGLHFKTGSSADLAKKIQEITSDDQLRLDMGIRARQDFLSKYSADSNYNLLMSIYEQARSR